MASGVTYKPLLRELYKACSDEYRRTIRRFKQTKEREDDMVAGFNDGLRTAVSQLQGMGVIEIKEEV